MILTPKPWGRWSNWTKPWGKLFQPETEDERTIFDVCIFFIHGLCLKPPTRWWGFSQIFPEFVSLMPRLWSKDVTSISAQQAGWLGIFSNHEVSNMTWWFPLDRKKNNSIYIGRSGFSVHLIYIYIHINQVWNRWEWPSPMKGVDQRHSSASEKWNGCGNRLRVLGVLWLLGSFRSSFSLFFFCLKFRLEKFALKNGTWKCDLNWATKKTMVGLGCVWEYTQLYRDYSKPFIRILISQPV